jgi:hypothetical protein
MHGRQKCRTCGYIDNVHWQAPPDKNRKEHAKLGFFYPMCDSCHNKLRLILIKRSKENV